MNKVAETDVDYQYYRDDWKTCIDTMAGRRAVHAGGEKYLARLADQDEDEYAAFQQRAGWYGATDRTKQALKGMIFRKRVDIKGSERIIEITDNITLDGVSLNELASDTIEEVLTTGRAGILVDHQPAPHDLSEAQAQSLNLRPYMQLFTAEQIISFRQGIINNKKVLTQVRLKGVSEVPGESEFETKTINQIQVLELDDGVYRQRIFQQLEGDNGYTHTETIVPMIQGNTFDYIPFFFVGVQSSSPDYDKPPLLDIADVNLDYYRTKADYKHGLHFTGLPTAVITGVRNEGNKVYRVGSTAAWVFPDPEADAKYLEFRGQGLQESREELKALKDDMAALGVRLLAAEKRQAEAAESHMIKRSGEHSILAAIANNTSKSITKAMEVVTAWMGIEEEVSAQLNTDFMPVAMTTQEMLHMFQLVQSGGLTQADYMWNLRQGERLDPNLNDEERAAILQTSPLI